MNCLCSVRVDMDIRNVTFIEEDANNKTRLYVYTPIMLATPLNVPVSHMRLDLYHGFPGIVIRIGKTNNYDTISFLAHVDTYAVMNMGNILLYKYIMTKLHRL